MALLGSLGPADMVATSLWPLEAPLQAVYFSKTLLNEVPAPQRITVLSRGQPFQLLEGKVRLVSAIAMNA